METDPPDPGQPSPEEAAEPAPVRDPRHPQVRDGGRIGLVLTILSAVLTAGLFGVLWAGRSVLAPPTLLTALVTFLPYLFGLAVAWCFALWSAFPDRRGLPVLLTLILAVGAWTWGPTWASRADPGEGEEVTVMTWNVRRLWGGPADGGDPLACVGAAVEEAQPDVLALLEVSQEDIERLEATLGLTCVAAPYQPTDDPRRGGLAACTYGDRWRLAGGRGQRFVDHEEWTYIFSEIEREGQVFNLLAVHLYPYAFHEARVRRGLKELVRGSSEELAGMSREGASVGKGQSDQAAALLHRMSRLRDPTVVSGDFNSTRDAALHAALRRHLTDTWERGGFGLGATVRFLDLLPLRIDYTYASPAFSVRQASVPDVGCSDHRPVISRMVLRAEPR